MISLAESLFSQLLSTSPPEPETLTERFWLELFCLTPPVAYLHDVLANLSSSNVFDRYSSAIHGIFREALACFRTNDELRRANALEILLVVGRGVLEKRGTESELMHTLGGGLDASEAHFTSLAEGLLEVFTSKDEPADLRHRTLQATIIFVASLRDSSIGAYFQNLKFYEASSEFALDAEMSVYAYEAFLLIGLLANYRKFESAEANRTLERIADSTSEPLHRCLVSIVCLTIDRLLDSYRLVQPDDPPAAMSLETIASYIPQWRDMVPVLYRPTPPPKRKPKVPEWEDLPDENAVILMTVHEFSSNADFRSLLRAEIEDLPPTTKDFPASNPTNLLGRLLSLSSYFHTHSSAPGLGHRPRYYSHLAHLILLSLLESQWFLLPPTSLPLLFPPMRASVRLCRQRAPEVPFVQGKRRIEEIILDVELAFLLHNLGKAFDVVGFRMSLLVILQVIHHVSLRDTFLNYHWDELYRAILSVLSFIAHRVDELKQIRRLDEVVQLSFLILSKCVHLSEILLPDQHMRLLLLYELTRSQDLFERLLGVLPKLSPTAETEVSSPLLNSLLGISNHYHGLALAAQCTSAPKVLGVIRKEVEKVQGVYLGGLSETGLVDESPELADADEDVRFFRVGCEDALILMPR